jgi:hypothetical protein
MLSHRGYFLCMNVSGSTEPPAGHAAPAPAAKTKPKPNPTAQQANDAVLAAFKEASRLGRAPGAILLQEYSWATGGSLKLLLESLGARWALVRQWDGSAAGERDAVVLYDTDMYEGRQLSSTEAIQTSTGERLELPPALPDGIREEILSYRKRWAGVHLAALNPDTKRPTDLQFLLVSYHGRSNKRQAHGGDKKSQDKLSAAVKRALSQDFVIEVAKAALGGKLIAVDGADCRGVPALVAGDWNSECEPTFGTFTGLAAGAQRWGCSHHAPAPPPGGGVRVQGDGWAKETLDYVVAVNAAARHERGCAVEVGAVQGLPLLAEHRALGLFDHDPLITEFTVAAAPGALRAVRAAKEAAQARIAVSWTARRAATRGEIPAHYTSGL